MKQKLATMLIAIVIVLMQIVPGFAAPIYELGEPAVTVKQPPTQPPGKKVTPSRKGYKFVWVEDLTRENGGYYVLVPDIKPEEAENVSTELAEWKENLAEFLPEAILEENSEDSVAATNKQTPPDKQPKSIEVKGASTADVTITQLAADNHVLALDSTKKLYGWGDNTYGQLGLGSTAGTKVTKPTRIPYFDSKAPIKQIATGKDVSYVLLVDGSVYEAGKGKTNTWTLNTQLSSLGIFTIYTKESCDYALALTADDTLYYWGDIPGNIGDSPVTSTKDTIGTASIDTLEYSANFIAIKHNKVVDGLAAITTAYEHPYLTRSKLHPCGSSRNYYYWENGTKGRRTDYKTSLAFSGETAWVVNDSDGTETVLCYGLMGNYRHNYDNQKDGGTEYISYSGSKEKVSTKIARDYYVNTVRGKPKGETYDFRLTIHGLLPELGGKGGFGLFSNNIQYASYDAANPPIAAGNTMFWIADGDEKLYATGSNAYGCAGIGTNAGLASLQPEIEIDSVYVKVKPSVVRGLQSSQISTIVGGRNTNYFLKTDGTVWAAGNNAQGQLGQGDSYHNTSSNVPLVLEFVVPPAVTGVAVSDEWGLTNTATITAVDTGNGLKEYAVSTQNTAPIDGWQSSPTFTVSANGTYYAFARDTFNTPSSGKEFRVNKVDRDKPVINNVSVPDILAASAKVNIAASDMGSGVKDYAITSGSAAPGTGWQSSPNFEIGTNGTYYAWVRDNVLNVSESRAFQINKVDGVKPTVTNVLAPTPLVNGRNEYTIVAVDNVDVTGYAMTTVRSAPSTGWQTSNKIPITENGTYFFWAKDLVGNISSEYMEVITRIPYRLTIAPTPHGSVTTAKKEYAAGDEVELTIHADKGYRLKANSLKENGRNIYNDIFLMRAANTTVTAEFEPIPYPIKTVLVRGGSIEADKPTAFIGDTVTVTYTPDKGYRIKENSLVENGRPITGKTFIMQPESTVVSCSFEPILYDITVQPAQHGTVKASAAQAIIGEKITLTAAPSEGYRLVPGSLKINGVSSKEDSFIMPAEPVTVTAAFEPILYDVTITPSTHGKVTADRTTAIIGDTVNVTVVPDKGYRLAAGSLKVGTEEIKDTAFVMKAKNAVITAQFEPIVYTVTVADTPHGKITTSKVTAIIGEEITISAVPSSGYKPVSGSIKVNGTTVEGNKFTMSAENAMVTGSFEAILYNIELKQSEHGTVTASKTTAAIGETVKLTLTPDKGYRLKKDSLQVDGKPIAGTTFTMQASSAVVTVQWEAIPYNVTITPSHNGTVTADKSTAVIGETVELSVKPAEGYKLVSGSIKVNGRTVENSFAMKAENAVITAEFEPVLYSLSLLQSPHGTITADKTTASIGDTVNLTVTPDSGYRLKKDSLRANGQRVTGSSFVMTAANTAIKAEFEAVNLLGTVSDTVGNALQGMTVTLEGTKTLTTATGADGEYSFLTVPNDTYTLTVSHYKWDTVTVTIKVSNGYIEEQSKLFIVCTRDAGLDILEALIRQLPQPLDDGSNDMIITEKKADILHCKKLYDELSPKLRKQLDVLLKNKLDKLLVRLVIIESRVISNLDHVAVAGLEDIVNKSDIVSIDRSFAEKITVLLEVDATDTPKEPDKAAIEEIRGNSRIGNYLDISLSVQVDENPPTQLTEIEKPLNLTIPIPASARGENYKIVRVHHGVAEELETTATDKTVSFATDRFSTYALVYLPYSGEDDREGVTSSEPPQKQNNSGKKKNLGKQKNPIPPMVVVKPENMPKPPESKPEEIIPTPTPEQPAQSDHVEQTKTKGEKFMELLRAIAPTTITIFLLILLLAFLIPFLSEKGRAKGQQQPQDRSKPKKSKQNSKKAVAVMDEPKAAEAVPEEQDMDDFMAFDELNSALNEEIDTVISSNYSAEEELGDIEYDEDSLNFEFLEDEIK